MADAHEVSNVEVVERLKRLIEKDGDDFRVKILRRAALGGGRAMHLVTFDHAQLAQLANAEDWLPSLVGGGPQFILDVFSQLDGMTPLGRLLYNIEGPPKHLDLLAIKNPESRRPVSVSSVPPVSPEKPSEDEPVSGL